MTIKYPTQKITFFTYTTSCVFRKSLDVAIGALEGVKLANQLGVKVGKALTQFALGDLLNIRSLEFDVRLAAAKTGHFGARLEGTIVGQEVDFEFQVNLVSVGEMFKSLAEKCKEMIESIFD